MVCDVPWAPIIHTYVDTPLNPYMGAWVGLIHHYTSNKARGWHIYWLHDPQMMDWHGWKKTDTLLASALDVVWCTMSSNHPYICWHHSKFINVFMDEVDIPLHKQPNNGVTSILATQDHAGLYMLCICCGSVGWCIYCVWQVWNMPWVMDSPQTTPHTCSAVILVFWLSFKLHLHKTRK